MQELRLLIDYNDKVLSCACQQTLMNAPASLVSMVQLVLTLSINSSATVALALPDFSARLVSI